MDPTVRSRARPGCHSDLRRAPFSPLPFLKLPLLCWPHPRLSPDSALEIQYRNHPPVTQGLPFPPILPWPKPLNGVGTLQSKPESS
jgi:hypothetical protein